MKIQITILFVLLTLLSAGSVFAQGGGGGGGGGGGVDFSRMWSAIEKTDDVIERAKAAVQESGSERAYQSLKAAVMLQEAARTMAEGAMTVEMGLRAGSKTMQARAKAERAIAITRQAGENEDYVRKRLEQTRELIQRMEGRIDNATPRNIRQLLDSAKDRLQRAVEFFRNGRLKASLQITLQIQKSLESAILKLSSADNIEKQYQYALERFYSLEERIQESAIGSDPETRRQLKAARSLMESAQQAYNKHQYNQAEAKMRKAVEQLYRLAEQLKAPARIESELASLKRRAARIKEAIAQDDTQMMKLFQTAEAHLEKAQQQFQNQQYDSAAAQLQAARQLLRRIWNQRGE